MKDSLFALKSPNALIEMLQEVQWKVEDLAENKKRKSWGKNQWILCHTYVQLWVENLVSVVMTDGLAGSRSLYNISVKKGAFVSGSGGDVHLFWMFPCIT